MRLDSGDILSARCSTDSLSLWLNGSELDSVPLPDSAVVAPAEQDYLIRQLHSFPSGSVLMSHYSYDQGCTMEDFSLYSISRGSWLSPESQAAAHTDIPPAMCADSLLAIADTEGSIHIFDARSGKQLQFLQLNIPASSIHQLLFLADGQQLLVYTEDLQLFIYDIGSGELLFRHQMYAYLFGEIRAYEDRENSRLYLADNSLSTDNCICIDTRSWTYLTTISGFAAYLPDSGECCIITDRESVDAIYVPSTAELADLAAQLLNFS